MVEDSSGGWVQRLVGRSARPRSTWAGWKTFVPIVCLAAGVIFAASARASHGTNLRTPETTNLADLVTQAENQVNSETDELTALQAQLSAATNQAASENTAVAAAQRAAAPLLTPAGLTGQAGPGIVIVLDDAPSEAGVPVADLNQLVVHQSDLQAVVNALWAGGAEAMTIAGQRVIATSAVRCVGNTLLLNGRVFSPPYRVQAIGPYATMNQELNRSPGVALFKQAASYYGLGYTVEQVDSMQLPAYSGPISLEYAKVKTP